MSGETGQSDPQSVSVACRYRLLLVLYPRDYRSLYGEEMLATSIERAGGKRWPAAADVVDLLLGAARVHLRRMHDTDHNRWREGLAIIGVLTPLVLLTGLATDAHEVAWFIWYGGFSDVPWRQAASDAPGWLAWAMVATLALLGWRRTAAVSAWLATAGMVVSIALGTMLPTPATAGGLLLALLAALALAFSPDTPRGIGVVEPRRLLLVAGAVVLVLFARLLGHHFTSINWLAWAALGAAIAYACQPRTIAGRRALVLLSAPATSAISAIMVVNTPGISLLRPSTPWPLFAIAFYGVPLLVLITLALLVRHLERAPNAQPNPPK